LEPVTTQSASTSIKQQKYGEKANDVQRIKIGEKFGDLTVLHKVAGEKKTTFLCRCKCGVKKPILRASLVSGNTKSCSCLHRAGLIHRNLRHGLAKRGTKLPTELIAYYGARERVKPSYRYHADYFDRGIRFLFKSFAEFYAEVGAKPSPELTLDRKNNDLGYQKGNLRWASRRIQSQNRRKRGRKEVGVKS
jgi:hypothetical protein